MMLDSLYKARTQIRGNCSSALHSLAPVWKDPDFNKDELAFYYVRLLEIPTPRWMAHSAKYFGAKDISNEVRMVTQERAYTSLISYTPSTVKN